MTHPLPQRFREYPVHACGASPPSGEVGWMVTPASSKEPEQIVNVRAQTWYFARAKGLAELAQKGIVLSLEQVICVQVADEEK